MTHPYRDASLSLYSYGAGLKMTQCLAPKGSGWQEETRLEMEAGRTQFCLENSFKHQTCQFSSGAPGSHPCLIKPGFLSFQENTWSCSIRDYECITRFLMGIAQNSKALNEC